MCNCKEQIQELAQLFSNREKALTKILERTLSVELERAMLDLEDRLTENVLERISEVLKTSGRAAEPPSGLPRMTCWKCGKVAETKQTQYGIRNACEECGMHSWGNKPLQTPEEHRKAKEDYQRRQGYRPSRQENLPQHPDYGDYDYEDENEVYDDDIPF